MAPQDYPFQSVFFDTCIVRYLATFPNMYYEGGLDDAEREKLRRLRPHHRRDIQILGAFVRMVERGAPHDVVITPSVVRELPDDLQSMGRELERWSHESGFVRAPGPHNFLEQYLSFLDPGDRHLYLEANVNGCDAFLTTDYRSMVARRHLVPRGMTRIITPQEWWRAMKPWAPLFF